MESKANRRKRVPRIDGTETRKQIIECAGKLIAKKGFAATTSKEICQELGINLAAINYHFGSREGLYVEILSNVHDHLVGIDYLERLYAEKIPIEVRVKRLLTYLIHKTCIENEWQLQLWIREILAFNPLIDRVIEKTIKPKLMLVLSMFGAYFKLPCEDVRLHCLIHCILSPIFAFAINRQQTGFRMLPPDYDLECFVQLLEENVLLNLYTQKCALEKEHNKER